MKSYSHYLFDLDGTLITTTHLICECFRFSLKKFLGVTLSRKEILVHIGLPLKKQFITFITAQGLSVADFDLDEIAKAHMDFQLSIWKKHVKPYPGAVEVLASLKQQHKGVAIVTSRLLNTATLYLNHTGLMPYCDVIITPESTERHKPEPEPVLAAITKLNQLQGSQVPADKVLMAGDSLFDLQAAVSAGADCAWILYPDNPVIQIINAGSPPAPATVKNLATLNHPEFKPYQKLAHHTITDLSTLLDVNA